MPGRQLIIAALLLAPAGAAAQTPLAGDWEGEARTSSWPLFLGFTISGPAGAPEVVLRVLGQTVEFTHVRAGGDSLALREGEGAGALIIEAAVRDSVLAGRLIQRADTLPFTLYRVPEYPAPRGRIEAWAQDLDALATRFLRWDRTFSPAERAGFLEAIGRTRDSLAVLTDEEVIVRMAKAIALADNAHTRLYLLRNRTALRRLPVRLWWFSDGLRVVRAAAEHRDLVGCRVEAIGGTPARHAREIVAPLYAGSPSWTDYLSVYTLTSPETLAGTGITANADSAVFTVSDCAAAGSATLKPLPLAKSSDAVEAWWDLAPHGPGAQPGWHHALAAAADSLPLYLRHPDRNYWFEYLPDSGILYLQYNRSASMEEESTEQFGERLLAELERRRPRGFVLDLRFNTGGNLSLAASLMKALQERTAGIPRWVLTGRATFSAGITHAASWRQAGNVTFVGEPVGDELDFWSEGGNVRLPNSGLDAHFANGFHSYSTAPCPADVPCHDLESPPLTIDLPVSASWAEYWAGRDPAMEAVLGAR